MPVGASAARSSVTWRSDATRFSTTPASRTRRSQLAKPCTVAATEREVPAASTTSTTGASRSRATWAVLAKSAPAGHPVEQAHDPLDDGHVGPGRP